MANAQVVPGRNCDGCALCCMVLSIDEIDKPQGKWCPHCSTRSSCDIYPDRPKQCRDFYCGYLTIPDLDDRWKPSRSKIILVAELDGARLAAHVQPSRPQAWREEPFYSQLKEWAAMAAPEMGQIVVCVGRHAYLILPDRDIDLGVVDDDHHIVLAEFATPFGPRLDGFLLHKDDPRAAKIHQPGWKIANKVKWQLRPSLSQS